MQISAEEFKDDRIGLNENRATRREINLTCLYSIPFQSDALDWAGQETFRVFVFVCIPHLKLSSVHQLALDIRIEN